MSRPKIDEHSAGSPAPPTGTPIGKVFTEKKPAIGFLESAELRQAGVWSQMDFVDRIQLLRSGIPAQRVNELASILDIPKEVLMKSLGLSRTTVDRKVMHARVLSPGEPERVIGVQALIGKVQLMTDVDRRSDFDATKWLASWLIAPLPALGGVPPASFLDTMEGQKHVGNLLEMTLNGTYA